MAEKKGKKPEEIKSIFDGIEPEDYDKPGLGLAGEKLVANIMGNMMDYTNNLTNSVIETYQRQADERGAGLRDILTVVDELLQEVPRSSEAGRLARLVRRCAYLSLYPSARAGTYKPLEPGDIYGWENIVE